MWLIILMIFLIIISILNKYGYNKEYFPTSNNFNNYTTNGYLMTRTELIFYRSLKKVTDKLNLLVFPQVNIQSIIDVKNNNISDRNKIRAKSVDFAIVNSNNCKIVCCIELDDYTHNTKKAQISDNFKNELFKNVNIPLHRIKVSNYYDEASLENIIKENINPPISPKNT